MPRPPTRPVTEADYDQVRELHAQGLSRNKIATTMQRGTRTVSRLAAEMGLSFHAERTREATAAKQATARERRATLALALLDDAARLRAQLWEAASYVDHGGKEFERRDWTMDEPTFADKAKIMQSVGIAVDRAVKLDEYDKDTGTEDDKSMLVDLREALLVVRRTAAPPAEP
ncbi:hypothetical protein EDC02_5928 [Micromonospora sp. Llam0]|uniref:helix-turn-helix domain-containing protein n=1 Tax=Micromonospora sp. Llam0 TaxID=2485143 RepID=UPI000F461E79|nr:helix-turn-helix domain-containing protein [Micromonospora sp. Llam0]ROO51064.1 hypothetical protein EDC02_5928 [Micromonospora sp. Llam0]